MHPPAPLSPPRRVLMGPGPSDVTDTVLQAMALPTIGHLDPMFINTMDEVQAMLRATLGTQNALTLPMSGTGSAGMETCFVNLIEPGDRVLVGVNGVFGGRMVEVCRRAGAEVDVVEGVWGRAFSVEDFRAAARSQYKLIALVHAETSTGVLQDLRGFRALADTLGALLVIDAVTSLGGSWINLDEHGVDAVYSGTQKCLSCPPGLAPVSFSSRAREVLSARSTPVQSWYLDLSLIASYWAEGDERGTRRKRVYHHTAPVNMIYGLHEALRLVLEEGLAQRVARHKRLGGALQAGLEAMGLVLVVPAEERLPQLTVVRVPDGIDEARVRAHLLSEHGLEIGGGLGPMAGKVWRIGLMGAACTQNNIHLCLRALGSALAAQGLQTPPDALRAVARALQD